jgi:hypothetical protein
LLRPVRQGDRGKASEAQFQRFTGLHRGWLGSFSRGGSRTAPTPHRRYVLPQAGHCWRRRSNPVLPKGSHRNKFAFRGEPSVMSARRSDEVVAQATPRRCNAADGIEGRNNVWMLPPKCEVIFARTLRNVWMLPPKCEVIFARTLRRRMTEKGLYARDKRHVIARSREPEPSARFTATWRSQRSCFRRQSVLVLTCDSDRSVDSHNRYR